MNPDHDDNRRPIAARSSRWAHRLTQVTLKTSITPNQISILSVIAATIGSTAIIADPAPWSLVLCAALIPVRLVCNLLDGMVAVEGGKHSLLGALYNEIPDRFSDAVIMVALGIASGRPSLGWAAALLAVATAYVRMLGGSLGLAQDFRGPLAKQQRMWIAAAGCVLGAIEMAWTGTPTWSLIVALWILIAGSAATCVTRTLAISHALRLRHD
ncbi:CDP-alcohol phosphatidyltransferase family protein [Acidiferrobacter sp.]|jgi:phosphatidylglycerophosphate synthase|nr:CDP-alcohol phosphatidyltransferase family protein [Acidiferrobacter sp.]